MEMEQIKDICKNHGCGKCPFYDLDYFECVVRMIPLEWDLEEIKRRLENYGKKENNNT